uniref:Putative bel-3-i nvi n=1 Tax=Xenopsylla cheopis TaxID=163159 RepID=A0A6M2DTQ3_XENCH
MNDPQVPLSKKRNLILSRIEKIQYQLTVHKIDLTAATLCFNKIKELFEIYDAAVESRELSDLADEETNLADDVRRSFYTLASKLQELNQDNSFNVSMLNSNIQATNSSCFNTPTEFQRLTKLPTAEILKFDGNFENWHSFKNTFKSIIDTRKDIDDLNKFLYLRSSLTGAASNKLSLYDASAENYAKAWKLLEDTYQKERALVYKHYDALINVRFIQNPTTENLNQLIDDARQHLNNLESLKAKPTEAFVVRILENKLPPELRTKWEKTFDDDNTLPTFDLFSKFITKCAFRYNSRRSDQSQGIHLSLKRRHHDQTGDFQKVYRNDPTARAFVTSSKCTCKNDHALYKCPDFKTLSVDQRIKLVKTLKLCQNCLRAHKGACVSIRCKICDCFHHTMLHVTHTRTSQQSNTNSSNITASNANIKKECTSMTSHIHTRYNPNNTKIPTDDECAHSNAWLNR